MSDRKKPGKNSSRLGKKNPAATVIPADGVSGFNAIPSPFLRAGFDIGVDLSAPRRQSSKETAALVTTGDVSGQADATDTPSPDPTPTPDSSAAASAKKSGLQTPKKGSASVSKKQALALKALGLEQEEEEVTTATKKAKASKASRTVKTPQGSKAQNKAAATPKKPKEDKTTTPLKVTPSKRPHDASIPDVSYWSSTYLHPITPYMISSNVSFPIGRVSMLRRKPPKKPGSKPKIEDNVFDFESDSATYKKNGGSDHLEHSSDDENDYLKQEREFALRNEVDDDDEYLRYYHGEDTPVKKPRT